MMRRFLIGILVALAGAFLFALGLLAIGVSGEDLCFGDMDNNRGSYSGSGEFFPPRVECVYRLTDGTTETIGHPVRAWASFGFVVLFPPTFLIGAAVLSNESARRRLLDLLA